jgi:hypothetical protein
MLQQTTAKVSLTPKTLASNSLSTLKTSTRKLSSAVAILGGYYEMRRRQHR